MVNQLKKKIKGSEKNSKKFIKIPLTNITKNKIIIFFLNRNIGICQTMGKCMDYMYENRQVCNNNNNNKLCKFKWHAGIN